jgi:hypothetical protein
VSRSVGEAQVTFLGSSAGSDAAAILRACSPLVSGTWIHWDPDRRRVAIELWWYREPTPEELTSSAKLAAQAFLEVHGTTRETFDSLKVLRGRERPAKGKLPPLRP